MLRSRQTKCFLAMERLEVRLPFAANDFTPLTIISWQTYTDSTSTPSISPSESQQRIASSNSQNVVQATAAQTQSTGELPLDLHADNPIRQSQPAIVHRTEALNRHQVQMLVEHNSDTGQHLDLAVHTVGTSFEQPKSVPQDLSNPLANVISRPLQAATETNKFGELPSTRIEDLRRQLPVPVVKSALGPFSPAGDEWGKPSSGSRSTEESSNRGKAFDKLDAFFEALGQSDYGLAPGDRSTVPQPSPLQSSRAHQDEGLLEKPGLTREVSSDEQSAGWIWMRLNSRTSEDVESKEATAAQSYAWGPVYPQLLQNADLPQSFFLSAVRAIETFHSSQVAYGRAATNSDNQAESRCRIEQLLVSIYGSKPWSAALTATIATTALASVVASNRSRKFHSLQVVMKRINLTYQSSKTR